MAFQRQYENQGWRVLVEDDDAVAYAYLLDGDLIVSDVWLYNRGPDPVERPWRNGEEMPFRNPVEFTTGEGVDEPVEPGTVDVRWTGADGSGVSVEVRLRGRVIAWLEPGARPGWSVRVTKDGPLAKRGAGRNR
jgi:hypothetical protein